MARRPGKLPSKQNWRKYKETKNWPATPKAKYSPKVKRIHEKAKR